jgi:hypothetical protein
MFSDNNCSKAGVLVIGACYQNGRPSFARQQLKLIATIGLYGSEKHRQQCPTTYAAVPCPQDVRQASNGIIENNADQQSNP